MRAFTKKKRLHYEKVLKKSLIDRVSNEIEGLKLKKVYDYYLNDQKKIISAKKVIVEDVFGKMMKKVITNE